MGPLPLVILLRSTKTKVDQDQLNQGPGSSQTRMIQYRNETKGSPLSVLLSSIRGPRWSVAP